MKSFKEIGTKPLTKSFEGEKIKIERVLNVEIIVLDFRVNPSKYEGERLDLQIELNGNKRLVFTSSKFLREQIEKVDKSNFPFKTTIIRENEHFEFT
jgi:hypothetical protein